MSTETEVIKKFIEERYKRLEEGRRRPSCEYITVQEIREIFSGVVDDTEGLLNQSDEEVQRFYQKWYEDAKATLKKSENSTDSVLELPRME